MIVSPFLFFLCRGKLKQQVVRRKREIERVREWEHGPDTKTMHAMPPVAVNMLILVRHNTDLRWRRRPGLYHGDGRGPRVQTAQTERYKNTLERERGKG